MTKTTEIGTVILPRRRVPMARRARNAVAYVRAYPSRLIPLRPPIRPVQQRTFAAAARAKPRARTARACPTVRAGRAAAYLLGRRRCRSRDSRTGRDVTRDLDGRRVG